MKKNAPTLISAALVIITVISLTVAMTSARKQRAAEEEANLLRQQVAELSKKKKTAPLRSVPRTAPLKVSSADDDTNAVAELESELTTLRTQLEEAQKNQRPERESREDRMARMKEEDPEGYAEMLKQREERRNEMRYNLAERTANFMELDTTYMSDTELGNHEELIQKMGDIWALTEQFQDPEYQPDRETMRELFGMVQEARPLMDIERTTMFRQLANDIGMEGEDAAAFSGYVDEIIKTTTIQTPRGGRGGGGGGGGGR